MPPVTLAKYISIGKSPGCSISNLTPANVSEKAMQGGPNSRVPTTQVRVADRAAGSGPSPATTFIWGVKTSICEDLCHSTIQINKQISFLKKETLRKTLDHLLLKPFSYLFTLKH